MSRLATRQAFNSSAGGRYHQTRYVTRQGRVLAFHTRRHHLLLACDRAQNTTEGMQSCLQKHPRLAIHW